MLEVVLPQLSGLEAANYIRRRSPSSKLLFTAANPDPDVAAEAFRRGASAYVLKQSGADEFQDAIRSALRGHSFLSPLLARETIEYLLRRPELSSTGKRLTRRQAEILQLLAEGNSMKVVADILAITPGTVAFHKYTMMEKLGVKSNAALLQYALKNHLVPSLIPDSNETRSVVPTSS